MDTREVPRELELPVEGTPVGRRVFLGMAGLGAAGIVWGSSAANLLERMLGPILVKDGSGLGSLLPVGRFRIYSVTGAIHRPPKSGYQLAVSGLVDRPFTLSLEELLALPPTGMTKDFQCVTGWRVRDVPWKGVLLSDLLDRAGVRTGAGALKFSSFDGVYTESLTLAQARRPDMLVAYELEGSPLSAAHGGPVRLYAAPMYGYKSIKWLDRIEVTAEVEPGYWEERGYDVDAWVGESNARQDEPV